MLSWGLGTAALWRDEGATTVAIRRDWPALWQLMDGSEAPLVPYYAVLKVLTGATREVLPGSDSHLEVFERWPSAAVMVLACWALVHWLCRVSFVTVAAGTGGVLVLLFGLSRYGQEARPYAMVMAMAVVATLLWWRLASGRPWRWAVPYGLAIGGMIALHALSASLVAAHLFAAVFWRRTDEPARNARPSRRARSSERAPGWLPRVAWTLGSGAAGAGLVAPLTVAAVSNGTGAANDAPTTTMLEVFLRLINGNAEPGPAVIVLMVVVLVVLPVIAILTQWFSDTQANLVRLATAWALLPLGLLTVASQQRPNLLATRYLVFVLPGWALLAGLGLAALATGLATVPGSAFTNVRVTPSVATVMSAVVQVVVLAVALASAAVVQGPSLREVRSPRGHGEDVRAILAIANRPELRLLPIQVLPPSEAVQISAYAPALAPRLINVEQPVTGPLIWPQRLDGAGISAQLAAVDRVVILIRGTTRFKPPQRWADCRVASRGATDRKWSYVVLERAAPSAAQPPCTP
jgi:hypothetical protein